MEKIIERNLLFDFYGELLTERQREIYQDAVYGDMSLSELSDNYGISRQGAHDFLKRCDKILLEYEDKLHLIEKSGKIIKASDEIKGIISNLPDEKKLDDKDKSEIFNCLDTIRDNL